MQELMVFLITIVFMYLLSFATYALIAEYVVIHTYIQYWKMVRKNPELFFFNIILLIFAVMAAYGGVSMVK
jgi:hypothetical protein